MINIITKQLRIVLNINPSKVQIIYKKLIYNQYFKVLQ